MMKKMMTMVMVIIMSIIAMNTTMTAGAEVSLKDYLLKEIANNNGGYMTNDVCYVAGEMLGGYTDEIQYKPVRYSNAPYSMTYMEVFVNRDTDEYVKAYRVLKDGYKWRYIWIGDVEHGITEEMMTFIEES